MVDTPCDKINYHKVSKYANIFIFKEFYPKSKNLLYYLNYNFIHAVCYRRDQR